MWYLPNHIAIFARACCYRCVKPMGGEHSQNAQHHQNPHVMLHPLFWEMPPYPTQSTRLKKINKLYLKRCTIHMWNVKPNDAKNMSNCLHAYLEDVSIYMFVPVTLFCKIFIPSNAFDALLLLCWNWLFSLTFLSFVSLSFFVVAVVFWPQQSPWSFGWV
jgi:hypothetical protein